MKKVLVTGAGGTTGNAVIKALVRRKAEVTAFVHSEKHIEKMRELSVSEIIVGDMANKEDVETAYQNVDTVYHISPAFREDEYEIGKLAIDTAKNVGIKHFVYHSVLHSILPDLLHHSQKRQVEEYLVVSGVPFTIIQPAILMQNILQSWDSIEKEGIFRQKFYTQKDSALCMVDVNDVAEAIAIIIENHKKHIGATYELCGPDNLKVDDIKRVFEKISDRTVELVFTPDEIMTEGLRKSGAGEYKIKAMMAMFRHYNDYDFFGCPYTLESILGRKPHSIEDFLRDMCCRK